MGMLTKVRIAKVAQFGLMLMGVYMVSNQFGYWSGIPPLLCLAIEYWVPQEYGWGLKGERNVFFKKRTNGQEKMILFSFFILCCLIVAI